MQYCTAFFHFVEKEASCLMQWKNASLKYESQTDRLILKVLTPNYANAVLNFQNRNRESFEAYEPTRPANFYTASYQQAVLKCEWDLALKQQCIRFYVFRKDDPQMIIGTVCLHDIRFAAYSCTEIGYKFDAAFRRMGYASEAIKKKSCHLPFTTFIFIVYSHVLCRKTSPPSTFLESLGFQYEGVERGCFLSRTDGQIICATRISTLPPTINSCIFFMHSPCQKRLHFVRQLFFKKRYQQPNRFSTCSGINFGNPKMIAMTRS